jgi:hypothetical protein
MALVVEDGTGLPNSDSYDATADIDAYAAASPIGSWWLLGTQAQKEAWAREATRYLDATYANPARLSGRKFIGTQALQWPRSYCYDRDDFAVQNNVVPTLWKTAHMELALRCAQYGTLSADQTHGDFVSREHVGPIDVSYQPGAPPGRRFPGVDLILAPLLYPANVLIRG